MTQLLGKRTTLVVYGAYPIVLDLVTTLLSEESAVIVADEYQKDKLDLFKDIKKPNSFKYITLDSIKKLESVINDIDYIFVLLDQHIDGTSTLSSKKYLEILTTLEATLEYAKSNKTKVAITFPINVYASSSSDGQYTTADLLTAIQKKINETTESNKYVRIVYTGEVLGHGMQTDQRTPFRDILFESIESERITILGEGLDTYYIIYSSDYVYGLVRTNFSKDVGNILVSIPERISTLAFAYQVIEHNHRVKDITFKKKRNENEEIFELTGVEYRDDYKPRFTMEEVVEKCVDYVHTLLNKQKIAKPTSVIKNIEEKIDFSSFKNKVKLSDVVEEELTPLGKITQRSQFLRVPITEFFKRTKVSWVLLVNNRLRFLIFMIVMLFVGVLLYFVIYPTTSLVWASYNYYQAIKQYGANITSSENTSSAVRQIKSNNQTIQRSWDVLGWLDYVYFADKYYVEIDKVVSAIDDITLGVEYWNEGSEPIMDYIRKLDIPKNLSSNGTYTSTSKEYTLELKAIQDNSSSITLAREQFFKAETLISSVDSSVFPSNVKVYIDEVKTKLSENSEYVVSAEIFLTELPDLAGINERKTYIILIENPYELRPQGGWISGYGILQIEHGQIKLLKFDNIYNLDGTVKNSDASVDFPNDMDMYMQVGDSWLPSQVNWDPDFNVVHSNLEYILQEADVANSVDGVIAVNLFTLEALLDLTGPITIPEFADPVTSSNLFDRVVEYHTNFEPGSDNKADILTQITRAIYDKLASDTVSKTAILDTFSTQLDQKNILVSIKNAKVDEYLSQQDWNGNLSNYDPAFIIHEVEWNSGGNKANAYLVRQISADFTLSKSNLTGKVTVKLTNNCEEDKYPEGEYKATMRVIMPKGVSITKVTGVGDYNVKAASRYTIIYIPIDVALKSSDQIEISFTYPEPNFESIILVKQAGSYQTQYSYKLVDTINGTDVSKGGAFEDDVEIPL